MTELQQRVQVMQLFATPVAVTELPEAASLNPELKAAVLKREQETPSTAHSNLGGWQSDWEMDSWGGPAFARLMERAKAIATQLTADREGRPVTVDWSYNAWANINRSGHGNESHTHPGAYWSGVYYVDDGGVGSDPSLGGEFEAHDPRGVAPAMYAPQLAFAMPQGQSAGASEIVRPKSGMMVLFPSWLSHAVRPYHGRATRISIAFNLSL